MRGAVAVVECESATGAPIQKRFCGILVLRTTSEFVNVVLIVEQHRFPEVMSEFSDVRCSTRCVMAMSMRFGIGF